jgi:reductive dehalogenase
MKISSKFQKMLVGPIKRFDQRNEILQRSFSDPKVMAWRERFKDRESKPGRPGFYQEDYALTDASWYVEDYFAMGNAGSNQDGLYAWVGRDESIEKVPRRILDPGVSTRIIKNAARFFGADLVGVCELNNLWLYSRVVNNLTGEIQEMELPDDYRYGIVLAIEMDYDFVKTSPTGGSAAATGLGYSKMAFVAGLLAQFIRGMGYGAIPCGNDTALSIPLAIEAGLGELGRNGLLITEKYGPRVRLCKVFSDMPLVPDSPEFIGVDRFCVQCKKCAQFCPSKAISFGVKTTEAITISNISGVEKWMIDPEKCFRFWAANRTDCSNCIRVCPFNQKGGWHHDIARSFIKYLPWLNPVFLWLHDVLNYDQGADPTGIWD